MLQMSNTSVGIFSCRRRVKFKFEFKFWVYQPQQRVKLSRLVCASLHFGVTLVLTWPDLKASPALVSSFVLFGLIIVKHRY